MVKYIVSINEDKQNKLVSNSVLQDNWLNNIIAKQSYVQATCGWENLTVYQSVSVHERDSERPENWRENIQWT